MFYTCLWFCSQGEGSQYDVTSCLTEPPLDRNPLDRDTPDRDPTGQKPLDRDPPGHRSPGERPPRQRPLDRDPGQRLPLNWDHLGKEIPLDRDPLDRDPRTETPWTHPRQRPHTRPLDSKEHLWNVNVNVFYIFL